MSEMSKRTHRVQVHLKPEIAAIVDELTKHQGISVSGLFATIISSQYEQLVLLRIALEEAHRKHSEKHGGCV